jgi:hypothetical protein
MYQLKYKYLKSAKRSCNPLLLSISANYRKNKDHVVPPKKCAFILTGSPFILRISTLVYGYDFCYKQFLKSRCIAGVVMM